MDELFETLTLIQTKRMEPIPVILFGKDYWSRLVNWDLFVEEGTISLDQGVTANVDASLRDRTRKNHSATHLLHLALKEVLGETVQQKGSLVAPDRLRFDYSHFSPLSEEEQSKIEERVNSMILDNANTQTEVGSLERAQEAGAVMLFGVIPFSIIVVLADWLKVN